MKVKNCMHKGAQWVSPEARVKAMASTMLEQDIGAIPVGENDRLIGMVTDHDIVLRALANGKDVSALTNMSNDGIAMRARRSVKKPGREGPMVRF